MSRRTRTPKPLPSKFDDVIVEAVMVDVAVLDDVTAADRESVLVARA